jgi:hypothetical protein
MSCAAKKRDGAGEFRGRDPESLGALIEQIGRAGIGPWIRHERKVVREVRALSGETRALRRDGNAVRERDRVAHVPGLDRFGRSFEAALHFKIAHTKAAGSRPSKTIGSKLLSFR